MAEFATNNNNYAPTKLFLFFPSRNLHICISFDVVNLSDTVTCKQINKKKTIDFSKTMQLI